MNCKCTYYFVLFALLVAMPIRTGYSAVAPLKAPNQLELKYVVLDLNGERTKIGSNETLEIVKGDLITLLEAWVAVDGVLQKAEKLDLQGFSPKKPNHPAKDDANFVIDTSTDLQTKYAVGIKRSEFEIYVLYSGKSVGPVKINIVPPRLDRVELSLNGVPRFLRDGDMLNLRPSDKIAVVKIVTNVRGNENIHHEIRPAANKRAKSSKELIFARGEQIFGRIPIQWQE